MSRRRWAATLASLVSTVALASAQTPALPTLDVVLAKYIAGAGGRAALEKITSVTATGTIEIPDVGLNGTVRLFQKAPDKAATFVDLTDVGQQGNGFDGTVGWASDPQGGVRDKTGAELAEARRSAAFPRELRMRSLYRTMTVTAREKVGTRDAVVVAAVPSEGSPVRLYFDAETGLLLRQVLTSDTPQGPLEVDLSYDDYREVDGIQRAFTIRQTTAAFTAVIRIAELTHNAPIDDLTFRKPR